MDLNPNGLTKATAYLAAELTPIPMKLDGSKAPAIPKWGKFQYIRPTATEMESFQFEKAGIAVIAGKISNNLEVIDIDEKRCYEPFMEALEAAISRDFIQQLCIIKTPRPGYQIWYRCPDEVQTAQKLAMTKDDKKVLIETRGEGSYVIAPGSPPSVHTNNLPYEVIGGNQFQPPVISARDRDIMINCAKSFDQRVAEHAIAKPTRSDSYDKKFSAVVEEFTESMTWKEILEPKGFILKKISDSQEQYQKPESSNNGIHLSVNYKGNDLLRCFSTACPPFDADRNYSKLEAYSLLNSNGNEENAILELIEAGYGWKEQKPLMRELPPAEEFPVDALGPILGEAAKSLRRNIQAPLAICCQSVLAAATLAVQAHGNVIIDGRVYPLSEFFLTVAGSGDRKSSTDKYATEAINEFEDSLRERNRNERLEYQNALDVYESARKVILSDKKDGVNKKALLDKLGLPPSKPLMPIMKVEEPTYEGLVKLFAEARPTLGIFSDEGGRFVGGHALNSENIMKTASGFSSLWDGKAITRSRSVDGTSVLAGRRCSMHLLMQPTVAAQLFSSDLLIGQGLLARCLVAWPESTAGGIEYQEEDVSSDQAFIAYKRLMAKLLAKELPTSETEPQVLRPREITLSRPAKKLWIQFHDQNQKDLGPGKRFEPIRGFASKSPEHVARLAGAIALFESMETVEIDENQMSSAISLVKFYRAEALRLFHSGAFDPNLVLAKKLLSWLMEKGKEQVTLIDIYQNGPNEVRQADTAKRLMSILIDHGWAKEITGLSKEYRKKQAYKIRLAMAN